MLRQTVRETIVETDGNEEMIGNSGDQSRIEMQGEGFMIGGRRFLIEKQLEASNNLDQSEFTYTPSR